MEKVKSQLEQQKKINSKNVSQKTTILSNRNELENIFWECVQETKKDVLKRAEL